MQRIGEWSRAILVACPSQPQATPLFFLQIKLLLTLFPKAQFIYMHRDPYAVFSSAANMAQKTYWYNYLATPSNEQVQAQGLIGWRTTTVYSHCYICVSS